MKDNIAILVVDDEKSLRELLQKILLKEGYSVDVAVDGQEALEKLRKNSYQLLLSDVKMPRLNGFELLKIVKPEFPDMGIIMMTPHGDSFTVKDVLLLGADEYITKPFKSYEINLIVERACWRLQTGRPESTGGH